MDSQTVPYQPGVLLLDSGQLSVAVPKTIIFSYPLFKPQKIPFKFTCAPTLSCSERGLKISNPDLCDAGALLHQLSYQANWVQVVMWLDYKPVDVETDDDNTGIFHVFEIRILND